MFSPQGVYVALMTPFDDAGHIDEAVLRRMTDFVIEGGVDGIFPVSSSGEAVHLGLEEKFRVMQVVAEQADGRVKITPGVGSSHPGEAVLLARQAVECGCDGVVAAPPYFYPLTQDMIGEYFRTIIDGSELPIILYNIPQFTQAMSYELISELAVNPKVVAIKESSGNLVDLVHMMDLVSGSGSPLSFFSGREEIFFPCLMAGAVGSMTASAGILPELMVAVYQLWKQGKFEQALKVQKLLPGLVRAMFSAPFPLGFKTALKIRGLDTGPIRFPLAESEALKMPALEQKIGDLLAHILEELNKLGVVPAR